MTNKQICIIGDFAYLKYCLEIINLLYQKQIDISICDSKTTERINDSISKSEYVIIDLTLLSNNIISPAIVAGISIAQARRKTIFYICRADMHTLISESDWLKFFLPQKTIYKYHIKYQQRIEKFELYLDPDFVKCMVHISTGNNLVSRL